MADCGRRFAAETGLLAGKRGDGRLLCGRSRFKTTINQTRPDQQKIESFLNARRSFKQCCRTPVPVPCRHQSHGGRQAFHTAAMPKPRAPSRNPALPLTTPECMCAALHSGSHIAVTATPSIVQSAFFILLKERRAWMGFRRLLRPAAVRFLASSGEGRAAKLRSRGWRGFRSG